MPPKKRQQRQSHKAQLQFHHQPLEGPKHHESLQRPITHTVRVPSKPIDKGTITSWVLPQFDTTVESQLPAHRKRRPQDQTKQLTRRSTCKFPQLTFEGPRASSSETVISLNREEPCQSEKDTPRRPLVPLLSPQSCGELSVRIPQSLPHVFIPPDIQTPELSVREVPASPDQKENSLPGCILGPGAPNSPEPGPILVKDTPEEKYGLKVTWRRRRHLFAYLKERGKLDKSQFLVKM